MSLAVYTKDSFSSIRLGNPGSNTYANVNFRLKPNVALGIEKTKPRVLMKQDH